MVVEYRDPEKPTPQALAARLVAERTDSGVWIKPKTNEIIVNTFSKLLLMGLVSEVAYQTVQKLVAAIQSECGE